MKENFILDIKNKGGFIKIAVNVDNTIALYSSGSKHISIYNKKCQLQEKIPKPPHIINNIYYFEGTLSVVTKSTIYKYNHKERNWEKKDREKSLLFDQLIPSSLSEKMLSCNPKIPISIRNLNSFDGIPQRQYFFWEKNTNKVYQKIDNFLIVWDQQYCTLNSKAYFFDKISLNHSSVKFFDSTKRIIFVHNNINKLYCQEENTNKVLFELKNNGDVNQLPFWVDQKNELIISFSWDKEKDLVLTKNYYKI